MKVNKPNYMKVSQSALSEEIQGLFQDTQTEIQGLFYDTQIEIQVLFQDT